MSGPKVEVLDEVQELIDVANSCADSAEENARLAFDYQKEALKWALDAGLYLNMAKSQCPHGEWSRYLADNWRHSPRTARKYMRLDANRDVLFNREDRAESITDAENRLRVSKVVEEQDDDQLTAEQAAEEARAAQARARQFSSKSNEWYTPPHVIELARQVCGGFDLDPASNLKANEAVQASSYFTLEDDGLAQEWFGRVWLNPPYGKSADGKSNIALFVDKLLEEYEAGRVTEAFLLIPPRAETKAFQRLFDFPICFVDGRLSFYTADGVTHDGNTWGSSVTYLGDNYLKFRDVFEELGRVVLPSRLVPMHPVLANTLSKHLSELWGGESARLEEE